MLLRPQALAGLVFAAALLAGAVASAEPLDKESCANLQIERKKLLTRDMSAVVCPRPQNAPRRQERSSPRSWLTNVDTAAT